MTKSLILAALVSLLAAAAVPTARVSRDRQRSPQETMAVAGRVIDGVTQRGASGALVTLSPLEQRPGLQPKQVLADAEGRFVFQNVSLSTRHRLVAAARGYLSSTRYGRRREVIVPTGSGTVLLTVWPPARISGRVVNQKAEGIAGLDVVAMSLGGGDSRNETLQLASTDEDGQYTFRNLTPGEYIIALPSSRTTVAAVTRQAFDVAAAGQSTTEEAQFLLRQLTGSGATVLLGAKGVVAGDYQLIPGAGGYAATRVASDGGALVLEPLFYGNSRSLASATPIALRLGEARDGLNLQATLVRGRTVRGRLVGPPTRVGFMGIKLRPVDNDHREYQAVLEVASTISRPDGSFTILGVPAGTYTLSAYWSPPATRATAAAPNADVSREGEPVLAVAVPVVVGEADVRDLQVHLSIGAEVSVSADFEGVKPEEALKLAVNIRATLEQLAPSVGPTSSSGALGQAAGWIAQVVPGRYLVRATAPPGWFFRGAIHRGQDVSEDPLFLASSESTSIRLVFTSKPSRISGMVRKSSGQVDADADVLIFPADSAKWIPTSRRIQLQATSERGTFEFPDLPPGEYFIVACQDGQNRNWRQPRFLTVASASAVRFSLPSGASQSFDLRTVLVK